jgi:hypothetical protein
VEVELFDHGQRTETAFQGFVSCVMEVWDLDEKYSKRCTNAAVYTKPPNHRHTVTV